MGIGVIALCMLVIGYAVAGATRAGLGERGMHEHFRDDLDRALHYLAHLLGWNMGRIETWWEGDRLMVAFRCVGCGDLRHIFEADTTDFQKSLS